GCRLKPSGSGPLAVEWKGSCFPGGMMLRSRSLTMLRDGGRVRRPWDAGKMDLRFLTFARMYTSGVEIGFRLSTIRSLQRRILADRRVVRGRLHAAGLGGIM